MERPNLDVANKATIVDQEPVKQSFINVLTGVHRMSKENAETIYEREAMYFKKIVFENEWLKASTGLSLYSSFLEIAINGLSVQPGAKSESYLEARNANQPKEGKENWVKVARLVITAYGELNMRIKSGQIIRMNNPIVLYEGDKFQPKTNDRGELRVDYLPAIPRKSKKIFGVWCSIVLPHDGIDFKWLLEDDIARLMKYSTPKANQSNPNPQANALYTSVDGQIDPGFLEAKCIKHAMRAYTKLKVSGNAVLEDEDQEEETFSAPKSTPAAVVIPKEENPDEKVF